MKGILQKLKGIVDILSKFYGLTSMSIIQQFKIRKNLQNKVNTRKSNYCFRFASRIDSKIFGIDFAKESLLLRKLLENIPLELAIYDRNGKLLFVNKLFVTNESLRKTLIGKNDEDFFTIFGIHPNVLEKRKAYFQRALKEKKIVRFTEKLSFKNQSKVSFYKRSYQPIFSYDKQPEVSKVCFWGSNITAVILSQKELQYLTYHDKITGLNNRDLLNIHLDEMLLDAARGIEGKLHAVLSCDLDNFKIVNNTIGHFAGDMVLREVAGRIKANLRKTDHIFRWGSDKFIILLKYLPGESGARRVAEKIVDALGKPYDVNDHRVTCVSASIGISLFPKNGADKETLLKHANMALYHAKNKGKNGYQFFNEETSFKTMTPAKIVDELNILIKKNELDKQLMVVYQPVIANGFGNRFKTIGVEALLRWNNPKIGSIAPAKFIPIAEELNLIEKIEDWVLKNACQEIQSLMSAMDFSLYLSVNMSLKQIISENMVKKIKRIVSETNFNPNLLQLEINENIYLKYQQEINQKISGLNPTGIRFAIDNLVSGYVSLAFLQKLPVSTLKMNKSFTCDINDNLNFREFVKNILMVGQDLNKEFIAKYVESIHQVKTFLSLGNNNFQGSFFSPPLTLKQLQIFLEKERVSENCQNLII